MFKAVITVTLRPEILDPQGKSTHHALQNLGFDEINSVRIGKSIELEISAENDLDARDTACSACEILLSNIVMEEYEVTVEPL